MRQSVSGVYENVLSWYNLFMEIGKFKNKYRIKSARLQGYDYSNEGFYFVTICTKNREMSFGDIIGGKMVLSSIGEIIKQEWLNTPDIRKNVELDKFVIMPNHLHGIVIIQYSIPASVPTTHPVETHCNASLRDASLWMRNNQEYKNKFGPQSNNLSAIIRGFKGVTTKITRRKFSNINFAWQPRFYDRIIRNDNELNRIRQYIMDNPEKWELDRNNPDNFSRNSK